MKRLEYFAPNNIGEALQLLDIHRDKAKVLAGGTDLLVQMNNNEINPSYLVDLKKINDLAGINYIPNEGLRLYPLTTISDIESSEFITEKFSILSDAAKTIGSVQIRNRATVGGNLCRAAPSADLAPALFVLEAQLKIRGIKSEKTVPIQNFFIGPGKTILKYNEILTEVIIPNPPSLSFGVYLKHGPRQAMDLATVGIAVLIVFAPINHTCESAKIALASVAPTPLRAKAAEKVLVGEKINQLIIDEAAKVASEEVHPITDVYGSEWYKRDIIAVSVKRAIKQVLARVKDQENEA